MKRSSQIQSSLKTSEASPRFSLPLVVCSLLLVFYSALAFGHYDFDFFTLTLGSSQPDVIAILSGNDVEFRKTDPDTIVCSPTEKLRKNLKEVILTFDRDELKKVTAYFKIPVTSSDADPLIRIFQEQKSSVSSQYGAPSEDLEEMKVERIEDRLAWLTRGRAYYRTTWNVGSGARICLWLYGEDSGLVLFKSMESTKK